MARSVMRHILKTSNQDAVLAGSQLFGSIYEGGEQLLQVQAMLGR